MIPARPGRPLTRAQRRVGRLTLALRSMGALILASLGLVLVTTPPSAAAPVAAIALSKSAPQSVLVGSPISYTLTATNPTSNTAAVPEYNLSFRDQLPLGVTYVAGSTSPSSLGEPTVYTAQNGQQTLVWVNVSDVAPGSTTALSFKATPDATIFPVGATVTNDQASAYANSQPRTVPKFSSTGDYSSGASEQASASASTKISALTLDKSEPSPEGELLRGVHDKTTVYTLKVTNAHVDTTSTVTVTDLLPAGLEFLGCGGVDNTTTGQDYPGNPSLTGTPTIPSTSCPSPTSVTTVTDPAGKPAGVYTQVTWNLGQLAKDQVVTIKYAAGIPQRANMAMFPGGAPSGASLKQAANLDNNTGASTRETDTEQSLTNYASAAGSYDGPVSTPPSKNVIATAQTTVTSEDVRLLKSAATNTFVQNGVERYTLKIDASEYADATRVVVVDHLPDGLCPLDDTRNFVTGSPSDCAPAAQFAPTGSDIRSVQQNGDGSFDILFDPVSVGHDGTITITYAARMRAAYTGGGDPTAANDTFTNKATLSATSTLRIDNPPSPAGPLTVYDDSSATITAGGPSLQKSILPRTSAPYSCGTTGTGYTHTPTKAQDTFSEGDRVCFKLRVDFPTDTDTRNPVLRDFMPTGVTYEAGSAVKTDANNVAFTVDGTSGDPLFTMGSLGRATNRFVPKGSTFEAVLSGIVGAPADGPTPDITANLAKFTYATPGGGTVSLRDQVDVGIAAATPLAITKGVTNVNGGATNNPPIDNVSVRDGDLVSFAITVTNNGSASTFNDLPVSNLDVWDVLPAGITCAQIPAQSDGGVCTDAAQGTLSVIRWRLTSDADVLAAGAKRTLTYDMRIPANADVNQVYANTAGVRSYQTPTDRTGVVADHFPKNNVDTTVPSTSQDTPAVRDDSTVTVAPAKLNKTLFSTSLADTTGSNVVVGETATYRLTVTVRAHTTVSKGSLKDTLPAGLTFVSASAAFYPDATSGTTAPLPTGTDLSSTDGTLTFPASYSNTTDKDQVFEVMVTARVNTAGGNTSGTVLQNTAAFTATNTTLSAKANLVVVAPFLTVNKTDNDADKRVDAGQVVTYTLVVANTGTAPSHDNWLVDCVPNGTVFGAFTTVSAGTASNVAGTGSNGCPTGTTRVAWNPGDLLAGTSQTLKYTVTVSPSSAGGQTYTNLATLSGSTLDDRKNDPLAADNPNERVVTASTSDMVTVNSSAITKTSEQATLTVGQRGTWHIDVTIPANVNFYDATILDQLPAGMDPTSVSLLSHDCTVTGGGSCSVSANPLTSATSSGSTTIGWDLGDITASTATRTVVFRYSAVVADVPAAKRKATLVNHAHFLWDLTDRAAKTSVTDASDQTSPDAVAQVTVVEPSLGIDKQVTSPTPAPGETFGYTVSVSNATGSDISDAYDVSVVDTVPTGVVVDAASISDGGTLAGAGANGGGTVTWVVPGPIRPGGAKSLTYQARLAASSTLTAAKLTNTADITSYHSLSGGGRTYDGPSDTADVTPAFPHVTVSKQTGPGLAYIGESKAFTITVTSNGGATARDVDVTDVLPPNWTYDGTMTLTVNNGTPQSVNAVVSTNQGTQTLTVPGFDLPAGQQAVLTYGATPRAGVTTSPGVGVTVPHTNTASVVAHDLTGAIGNASGSYSGGPANASAYIASADVKVTKTHVGSPVPGQPFTWTIRVTNQGADTAVGPFQVVDTLPSNVGSSAASGQGWSCGTSAGTITCTRVTAGESLAPNASLPDITVTTAIPASVAEGASVTNQADATERTYDPTPGNNHASDTATAVRSVDLEIVKRLSGAMVAGSDVTYTLDVSNLGPSDSTGPITVSDAVPAGTSYVGASGTGWTCGPAAGVITCTRTSALTVGAAPQITVTLHVDADRTADVTNQATVAGPSTDPTPGNNVSSVTTTPGQSADLGIQKSSTTRFVAGRQGTYEFTVHNYGPSYADGPVHVTDTLPTDLTYAGFTSVTPGWSCSAVGQVVTCDRTGRLALGADAVVDITVDIAPSHLGGFLNEASVSSKTSDPAGGNNTDGDNTGSDVEVDLTITKSHQPPVVAGQQATYTLHVTNEGPSDATGVVTVVDDLPAGMTYSSASGTGWTCTGSGQQATCTHPGGLLLHAALPDITVVADVASSAGPATLDNVATVKGTDTDVDGNNNTAHDPTAVTDSADVSITKTTTGADPVKAGNQSEFTLVVHNDGPSDADTVSVTDSLPSDLVLVSVTGTGWTCSTSSPVVCSRPVVAAHTDAPPIVVTVRVASGVPDGTTITNTGSVSTSTPGDDPANDSDDADLHVGAQADLSLTKTHPAGPVVAGTPVTFDLTVTDQGPSDAVGPIRIVDQLPVGLGYVSSSGPWTCTADAADAQGQRVVCELDGNAGVIAKTTAPVLHITARLDATAPAGTVTNRATVDSPTSDPVPADNTATDDVEVSTVANLSVVKSHTDAARVGDQVRFTLQVANRGPSVARQVRIIDPLPTGLAFVSAEGNGWSCSAADGKVVCDLAQALAPNTSAAPVTLTTTVGAAAYPRVTNTATVGSATPDSDQTDNTSSDQLAVPAQVDLGVVKTHEGQLVVGDHATYHLDVTNHGPTDDPGPVTLTDPLPQGLSYVSATGDGWECSEAGGTVTCVHHDGLAVGVTSRVELVVAVSAAAYPSVSNVASVGSDSEDVDPTNDTSTDDAGVTPAVDLGVDKKLLSLDHTSAHYRITVSNHGPNDTVSDVVVVDTLPAQLTYDHSSGAGWRCTPGGRVVTCVHAGTITVGDDASFELVAKVKDGAHGKVVNTATVTGGHTGPDPSDTAAGHLPAAGEHHHHHHHHQPTHHHPHHNPGHNPGQNPHQGPAHQHEDLPNTGGPSLLWLTAALACLAAGGLLIGWSRRTR